MARRHLPQLPRRLFHGPFREGHDSLLTFVYLLLEVVEVVLQLRHVHLGPRRRVEHLLREAHLLCASFGFGGPLHPLLSRAPALLAGDRSDLHGRLDLSREAHLLQFPRLDSHFLGDAFTHFLEVSCLPEHGDFSLSPLLTLHVASLSTLLCEAHVHTLFPHELVADDERAATGVTTTHDITLYPSRLRGACLMTHHHIHFCHRHYQWLVISGCVHH